MRHGILLMVSLTLVSQACPEETQGQLKTSSEPHCVLSLVSVDKEYNCSGLIVSTVDKDRNAAIRCDGRQLNCSGLPTLSFGMHKPIQQLFIEQCALPDNLMCVMEKLNATGLRTLLLRAVSTPLTAETVRGLDMMVNLLIQQGTASVLGPPGPHTKIPVEVIQKLPHLLMLQMQQDGVTSLVPLAFNQSGVPELRTLELSLNNITELREDTFYGLRTLKTLNLYKNHFTRIDVNAFRGLDVLEILYLDDNDINDLPVGVFSGTPALVELTSARNGHQLKLQAGVVSGLQYLKKLDFTDSESVHLESQSLSSLPALQTVLLKDCSITDLPEDLFLNTEAVTTLNLNSNKLKSLPEMVFYSMKELDTLDLSNNLLQALSAGVFRTLHKLTEINLDGNLLTSLPDELFHSLPVLYRVSISNNLLSAVGLAFQGAQARHLDLSHNQLPWECISAYKPFLKNTTIIPDVQSPLHSMEKLEHLDLSYNRVQSMCDDWRGMLHLNTFNISHNHLTTLRNTDTNFLSANITIDLRHNLISSVEPPVFMLLMPKVLLGRNPYNCDCKIYDLLKQLRQTKYDLTDATCHLPRSLTGVSLTAMADGYVDSSLSVNNLTCPVQNEPANCDCVARPNKKRTECTCLCILPNTKLPDPNNNSPAYDNMMLSLHSVQDLHNIPDFVHELVLSDLEMEKLLEIPVNVSFLDLRRNKLHGIPIEILQRNIKLMLEGNALECTCSYKEQISNIVKYQHNIVDYNQLKCTDENVLSSIDASRLCTFEYALYSAIIVGSSCIFLAIIIVLYCRYSLEIHVYLFNHGCTFIVKEEAIDVNKHYDIFLSFVHEDEDFVLGTLLPELDKEYKVCVHTRDWIIGDNIVEQIYRSVADSRRTLIVLSDAFLKFNSWSMEEFRAVQTQTATDKIPRAVIILRGEVNCDAAPEEIRTHLDINTYIKWGDGMFWDRLRYALPKNKLKTKDMRRKELTSRAVKNLAQGAINVTLNSEGQLVNTKIINERYTNGLDRVKINNIINNVANNNINNHIIINNVTNDNKDSYTNMNNHVIQVHCNGKL